MASELEQETRDALLSAIKASAKDETRADQLLSLSTAFAFALGAYRQKLPGYAPSS